MKEKICFSIIIPVYKVEKYIDRCILSILNQTYKNLDIILVDDGSPDNCPNICDEYAKKDNRIKVIHKKNGGLSDARNVGCEKATGDYVWYIDSDDEIIPTAIEELVNIIEEYNSDLICFNFKEIIEETQKEANNVFFSYTSSKNVEVLSYSEAIDNNINRVSIRYEATSKVYKREIAKQVKFPVGELAEDFATFFKFLKLAKNIAYYDNQLYVYYKRLTSIMGTKTTNLYINTYNNEIAYYKEIQKLNLNKNTMKKADDNLFKTLIKTYVKLYKSENQNILKDIENNLTDVNYEHLSTKSKILFILYKIHPKLVVYFVRKLYSNL